MKTLKTLLFTLFIGLVSSCNKDDGKIDFTFLQVNDVYEIAPIQGGKFGGLARVETIHQELLSENKNTMLFMAGDFLNPSLLGTIKYNGDRIRGKQMIEVMNAMNFDLVSFGNHEFDLSKNDLQKRLNESTFEWISANVRQKLAGTTYPFYSQRKGIKHFVPDSFIKEFEDEDGTRIKVGFISVCIDSNPKSYVQYNDIYKEAMRSYTSLKENVDIIFGLTHVSIEQDKKIAAMLPNIPLIMGGHEHTNMSIPVGTSKITKADANAKTVYIHKVSYDKRTKKAIITSDLKEVNEKISSDKKVAKIVDKWQVILKSKIRDIIKNPEAVIFTAKIPLEARDTPIRSVQTNMGEIITKAMSFGYDNIVDCALVNGGSIRIDDVLKDEITAVDIFRVLPYGGSVLKVELQGGLLKKVLDFGENSAGKGSYLQRYNVEKVGGKWQVKNQEIIDKKIYTVAFSDYLLKGYDIPFLSTKNKEVISVYYPKRDEKSYDIRKTIIEYLKTL